MADYKILITDFILTLQKLDKDGAPDDQIVEYVRRNSSRLIDESELDEMTIANIKRAKDCIPEMATIELELDDDVYWLLGREAEKTGFTIEQIIVKSLHNFIEKEGL